MGPGAGMRGGGGSVPFGVDNNNNNKHISLDKKEEVVVFPCIRQQLIFFLPFAMLCRTREFVRFSLNQHRDDAIARQSPVIAHNQTIVVYLPSSYHPS